MNHFLPNINLKESFSEYLTSSGLSPLTLKFYKSDLNHFSGWAILKLSSLGIIINSFEEAVPFLSSQVCKEYLLYLVQNKTPHKTANRRLSTLRSLSKFLIASQILDFDFTHGIQNLAGSSTYSSVPVILDFQKHLEAE